jgi:hypothetical protein
MTHHQPDTHLCTQQDTYHDEPRDLGLQVVSTPNMRPLTKHKMVVRTAALVAIDAENAYFDSAGRCRHGPAAHAITRFERSNMIAVDLE